MAKLDAIKQAASSRKSRIQSSKDLTANNVWWMLLGAPKHGKTIAAATMSEKYEQGGHLEDILYWQFDRGGVDSLAGLGLSAPVIDLSTVTEAGKLTNAIKEAAKDTYESIRSGVTKTVIFDAISTYDSVAKSALVPQYDGGKAFGLYDALLAMHMQTLGYLKKMECNVILICHCKPTVQMNDEDSINKKAATTLPGNASIVPDLTGKTLTYVRGQCSAIFPVVATPNQGGIMEHNIYPEGIGGVEAGNRYKGLDSKEPANLRNILAKIKR